MIFSPQTPKIVCKRGALLTYTVVTRRSEGQRHLGKSVCSFEVVPFVGVVRGEHKSFQRLFTAQWKDFQKAFNKLLLKRLLKNIFKNVPEKGGMSERTNLLMLNDWEEWKCKDDVKTYRKMAQQWRIKWKLNCGVGKCAVVHLGDTTSLDACKDGLWISCCVSGMRTPSYRSWFHENMSWPRKNQDARNHQEGNREPGWKCNYAFVCINPWCACISSLPVVLDLWSEYYDEKTYR